jgi:hypothetical protein
MEQVFSHRTMQALYEVARKVLDEGASPTLLRQPLKELDAMVRFRESQRGQQVIEQARELHIDHTCMIDIDDATIVYHNETDGYWVQGWCFVPDTDDGGNDGASASWIVPRT